MNALFDKKIKYEFFFVISDDYYYLNLIFVHDKLSEMNQLLLSPLKSTFVLLLRLGTFDHFVLHIIESFEKI